MAGTPGIPQVKDTTTRRAARGTAPKTGMLEPGSKGQPTSPRIGVRIIRVSDAQKS